MKNDRIAVIAAACRSDPSRRSSSATLSSRRRYRSSRGPSSARSSAFSVSLASITARSRATSAR